MKDEIKSDNRKTKDNSILNHNLNVYFPELSQFETTSEMENSEVYKRIRPQVEEVLNAVVQENFALESTASDKVKCLAWNIERGKIFDGILDALTNHADLNNKDLLLLTELDCGMARSENRNVAREIAQSLKLNYAFATVYIALQKGSGVEANVTGENTNSIHGLATFSKFPIKNAHAIPLPNGKDKMFGNEKRLGCLRALVAEIEHPIGSFRAVTLHLDAHSSRNHRHLQMKIVLDHLETLPNLPTIIGGDWNTTTFNSQTSTRAILGYFRRIAMGIRKVAKNHFPHPDRYFERGMFAEIEARGFEYKSYNEDGVGTLHYDMDSEETNKNLRDWVPRWCFPFLFWAAKQVGGKVSGRLDWFAGKGFEKIGEPKTIGNLKNAERIPLSDHDAITLDFRF